MAKDTLAVPYGQADPVVLLDPHGKSCFHPRSFAQRSLPRHLAENFVDLEKHFWTLHARETLNRPFPAPLKTSWTKPG